MQRYEDSVIVDAPIDEVFAYYTNVRNLAKLVPESSNMRIVKAELPLRQGSRIRFAIRPMGVPFDITWDARVTEFEENRVFSDKQIRGPFDHWVHRHEFHTIEDGRTVIRDVIEAGALKGILGAMIETVVIRQMVHRAFDYRREVLRQLFNKPENSRE